MAASPPACDCREVIRETSLRLAALRHGEVGALRAIGPVGDLHGQVEVAGGSLAGARPLAPQAKLRPRANARGDGHEHLVATVLALHREPLGTAAPRFDGCQPELNREIAP